MVCKTIKCLSNFGLVETIVRYEERSLHVIGEYESLEALKEALIAYARITTRPSGPKVVQIIIRSKPKHF